MSEMLPEIMRVNQIDLQKVETAIHTFATMHALVVGDVILDEYLVGRAERISREAPIPVLEFQRRDLILGGGTNPAANMAVLGAHVAHIGVVGSDNHASTVRALLDAHHIESSHLITDSDRPTTVKLRIMATMGLRYPQQVARVDTLSRAPISDAVADQVIEQITQVAAHATLIMASDYLGGLLVPRVVDRIRALGEIHHILTIADAQSELSKYRGYDVIKCNADEAARYLGVELQTDQQFAQAAHSLTEQLHLQRGMLITRGAAGMTVLEKNVQNDVQNKSDPDRVVQIPARHIEDVYDTVGAGDTVLAIVGLGLAAGLSLSDSAYLANIAAGIVIRKVGNYTPGVAELLSELHNN